MPLGEGTVLGRRYRLLSQIGRGGMGTVWHAHDDLLDRDVAVKEVLFPPGLTDAERRVLYERTLREARSAARLSHPGIVTVHDVVEEDGRPCIVMEFVRSRSLQDVIDDQGRLPPPQVAEIGGQVLAALRAAHAAGITHRDVKPANVLLATASPDAPISRSTRVVITDFGIATMEGDVGLTQTGLVMGSPAYIAPERARGEKASAASDLWSLGATLYAACEGHSPYHRSDAMAALTAILADEPPEPRHAGPLAPVLMGLLVKDPARRMTADQAADGLVRAANSTRPLPPPDMLATARDLPDEGAPGARDMLATVRDLPDDGAPGASAGHGSGAPGGHGLASYAPGPGPGEGGRPGPYGSETVTYGSGAGPRPPAYTGAPWPPSGGQGRAAERPATARSRLPVIIGVVALVAVTVLVTVLIVRGGRSGDAKAASRTSGGPARTSPTSGTPSPTPPPLPDTFHQVTGPHGCTLMVPRGWTRRVIGPESVRWTDTATGAHIQVDTIAWNTSDPRDHWRRFVQEARSGPNLPGFRSPRLSASTFPWRGWQTADLEYDWDGGHGATHAYDRGFTANGRQYAVLVAAPSARFEADWRGRLAAFYAAFQPGAA